MDSPKTLATPTGIEGKRGWKPYLLGFGPIQVAMQELERLIGVNLVSTIKEFDFCSISDS